jgi:hypothetical protein
MISYNTFSGSYDPQDVTFLLKVIDMPPLNIKEREYYIQSGKAHYSEMIGSEQPPTKSYIKIFYKIFSQNLFRLSDDLIKLAITIAHRNTNSIALVSIARSGTPIGVILCRILRDYLGRVVKHYSISIIRDKGIDENALDYIVSIHGTKSILFVDGWTGKGAIAKELAKSVANYNKKNNVKLDSYLSVILDLAGISGIAVGIDDYLIPSCLLNSVVSGLISRTILNSTFLNDKDFHGCLYYKDLEKYDLSNWFVNQIMISVGNIFKNIDNKTKDFSISNDKINQTAIMSHQFLEWAMKRFKICDYNLIKPGLGEATRVLLRRIPELLILKDCQDPDVEHLIHLANEKGVKIEEFPTLSYKALSIIKRLDTNRFDNHV